MTCLITGLVHRLKVSEPAWNADVINLDTLIEFSWTYESCACDPLVDELKVSGMWPSKKRWSKILIRMTLNSCWTWAWTWNSGTWVSSCRSHLLLSTLSETWMWNVQEINSVIAKIHTANFPPPSTIFCPSPLLIVFPATALELLLHSLKSTMKQSLSRI